MLHLFEEMARTNPRQLCFTALDATGREVSYTYHQVRLYASALSQVLLKAGVRRGDYVSVSLPNVAAWPLLLLAAAYGNFALLAIDPYLTDMEKAARRNEIGLSPNGRIAYYVDTHNVADLMAQARALIDGGSAGSGHASARASLSSGPTRASYLGKPKDHTKLPPSQLRRYATDAEESVVHFADHQVHLFDPSKRSVVMFTAGSTGKSKAVPLTWANIVKSAQSFNAVYAKRGRGVWQAALPFHRVDGLQVLVRGLCNCAPFVTYETFDARTILSGYERLGATHLALTDIMLRDLLQRDKTGVLARYTCLVLSGSSLNRETALLCQGKRLRLFVGYGMTETAGQLAVGPIPEALETGMSLLPGYSVRVVDEGPDGYGKLAVKGPGVCGSYFSLRLATTADGLFLTGDTAQLLNGRILVRERTSDVFVSGGENVFPEEVRRRLLKCAGVKEAYVFGSPDSHHGRCPIAFVERDDQGKLGRGTARQCSKRLSNELAKTLSRNALPRFIFPLDAFPLSSTGRVDTRLLEKCFEERIEVARVVLHHVRVPFSKPVVTPQGEVTCQDSLLVEVVDHQGRTGMGECSLYVGGRVQEETFALDKRYIQAVLAPRVIGEAYLHPAEVYASLVECPGAVRFPHACAAVEMALWDLYGKITKMPLWQLIGGQPTQANGLQVRQRAAAVVSQAGVQETVESVWRCAEAGYGRVRIEVAPGSAYDRVRAVRQVFPDIEMTLDAHQSFGEADLDELMALDSLGASWIEEPLEFGVTTRTAHDRFARLAALQKNLITPICLAESVTSLNDAYQALEFRGLRYFTVQVGKFGGIRPTLDFARCAQAQGVHLWVDTAHELGVYRRVATALQALPHMEDMGNIGSVLRDYSSDIADPPHTVERGLVTINRPGAPYGIGCKVDAFTMGKALVESIEINL